MIDTKKNVLFYSIIFLALVSAGLEVYLIYFIVTSGQLDVGKSLIALLNGAITFGALRLILRAWKENFIGNAIIDSTDLQKCFSHRLQIVLPQNLPSNPVVPHVNRQLITQYLILLEALLAKKLGRFHYELSVFCDKEHPEIIAYYDSSGNLNPRSQQKRANNPKYYVDEDYEVVEILNNPNTQSIVIEDTKSGDSDYSFADDSQRTNIQSTLLHCIEQRWPAVLVITCNKQKVLGSAEGFREAFLGVYNAIAADINMSLIINAGIDA
jgi:hypothetical protein